MSSTDPLPRRRTRVTPRAIVLAAVVIALLVAISYPVRQYLHERSNLAALEAEVEALEDRNDDLRDEIERFEEPWYIEYLARKCLGMVRRGEVAFVVVPEGGDPAPPDC